MTVFSKQISILESQNSKGTNLTYSGTLKFSPLWLKLAPFLVKLQLGWIKYRMANSHIGMPACRAFVHAGNHSNCTALPLSHGEMVRLDEGRFPALELNNRRLSVKNSFCRKNGIYTRSVATHAALLCPRG